MKQSLQLKLSQQLTLTPQLQQSIKLLQLSTLDLNQEIEKFLQENPLLERADDFDEGSSMTHVDGDSGAAERTDIEPVAEHEHVADAAAEDDRAGDVVSSEDWGEENSYGNPRSDDDEAYDQQLMVAAVPTLREHLEAQLRLTALDQRDLALVTLLIDTLDEDGFLTQPLDEILESLPPELGVEPEELQVALRLLQTFEPAGIAARNLVNACYCSWMLWIWTVSRVSDCWHVAWLRRISICWLAKITINSSANCNAPIRSCVQCRN